MPIHLCLLGVTLLALVSGSARAAERIRVAILPVVVHSDGPEDYLRNGLADMLASRLGQQPGVEVLRVEDPEQATVELAAARAAARGLGADFVLFGSFSHFGEGASLDLACAPVPEARQVPREIFVQTGTLGEIIPRLSELAQKVGRYLSDPAAPAPVSAPPPGGAPDEFQDALSELDELRARVGALESQVFEPPGQQLPQPGSFEPDPEEAGSSGR